MASLLTVLDRLAAAGWIGRQAVEDLAREIKTKADAAWDACSAARAAGDDLTGEFEHGKAVALCEILGDQEALARLIDP